MINLQSIVLLVISYVVIPRLTFLPKSVHTLLIIFGPFVLPKVIDLYNTVRASARSAPVRPTPLKVQRALNLLFVSAVTFLVLSLPYFSPENIFLKTQSRLQIEPNVLLARLRLLRPLTDEDELLREKFASVQNKLLYLAFGPDTLLNCLWCSSGDGKDTQNYLLYSLPKVFTPHIAHLAVLGLVTSSMVGSEGSRFRTHATLAGLLLMVAETWFLSTYDITTNKKAKILQDLDFVHWRLQVLRYLSFAVVDASFGFVLWLTSTNRWLGKPTSIAERLEMTTRQVEQNMSKMQALSLMANSINRDPGLRILREAYWRHEGHEMAEVVQEEDVAAQINAALGKMDMPTVGGQIDHAADSVLAGIDSLATSPYLAASQASS